MVSFVLLSVLRGQFRTLPKVPLPRWQPITVVESESIPMPMKTSVGILGATGIVGQRFVQMLEHHPWFEVAWLAASDRSEGKEYAAAARWRLKTAIPASLAKMRVSPATPEGA